MTKLKKLLVAALLLGSAFALKSRTAEAVDWCKECERTGMCFYCCKCEGYTTAFCAEVVCP
jgi:hypothetical protein